MRSVVNTIVALALVACAVVARADDKAWSALAEGGHVVLMRHAITVPGVGDPPGMRLDACDTQRNLSDEGRRHARETGAALRARGIAVERVLSSPWCRCLETARLAFGSADVAPALGNLFGRPENRDRQVAGMRALIDAHRGKGNLVLVSHGSTIAALTAVSLGTAEMPVVSPRKGGGFDVKGRLTAYRP
jgi:broad specificity phosphatase PhoE